MGDEHYWKIRASRYEEELRRTRTWWALSMTAVNIIWATVYLFAR